MYVIQSATKTTEIRDKQKVLKIICFFVVKE